MRGSGGWGISVAGEGCIEVIAESLGKWVWQEALLKLKCMLSLHEARASAEESNTGERCRGLGE